MKKNKSAKNLPVKGNQKLTNFFKKVTETDEQKSTELVESSSFSVGNCSGCVAPNKRRCNWDIDNQENENRNGCVQHPSKKKTVEAGLRENGKKLLVSSRLPIEIHHNKYKDAINEETLQTEFIESSPKLIKTPLKVKLFRTSRNSRSSTKNKTPEKNRTPTKDKTPIKNRTPTKLYNKSPRKLQEFNVEIITNFITLTPSKTNKEKLLVSPVKHEMKDPQQLTSNRSIEAQKKNEKTPTKSNFQIAYLPTNSTAKIKLDFGNSSCTEHEKGEISKINHGNKSFQTNISQESFNLTVEDNLFEQWEDSFFTEEEEKYNLNLTDQHCKVLNVEYISQDIKLTIQSLENQDKGVCLLKGFWTSLKVNIGNELYISATFDELKSCWYVDNTNGLVVYEPSYLLSTTTVVGGLFCKRKTFLKECFRGFEPPNKFTLLGTFIHELLQSTLRNDFFALSDIKNLIQRKIHSPEIIYQFYLSSLKPDDFVEEISEYASRIYNFVNRYVKNKHSSSQVATNCFNLKENWREQIDNVKDIEENIWCPQLGLKGKIDVTCESKSKLMPLELKTGRASVSLEHRGQVMLYIMMLAKLGYDVSAGLLLYLKDEVLREIPVTTNERRDLIILRNELTYYLTNTRKRENISEIVQINIPEPINHHSACAKCEYNVLCCSYLKYENKNLQKYKHLRDVQSSVLAHLKPIHIDYFVKWSYLLDLEGETSKNTKNLKEIYTVPPIEREKKGCCIIDLKIKETNYDGDHLYSTTFEKIEVQKNTNFYSSGIGEGNYIIISIDSRPAVASGFVSDVGKTNITVSMDRDLEKLYPNKTFYLDTYESSTLQTFIKTSLAIILEDSSKAAKLRDFIVEKKIPTFQTKLSKKILTRGTPILRNLNKHQQRAVLKALSADDFLLIQGMPGSGKTATIVALVHLMTEIGKTVLITSHTHSAVDNVCVRLIEKGLELLRLGSESRINSKLHSYSERSMTKDCKTAEQLEEIYNNVNIVAVTCFGSSHPLLSKRVFDVCIVDESTQILQPSAFRPLCACEKFVLVGDPHQLPPVVKNKVALEKGLSESLFDRLQQPENLVKLTCNYRMNKRLTEVANILTYNGELEVANDDVGNATLQLPKIEDCKKQYESQPWLIKLLNNSIESSFQILDTGPTWNLKDSTCYKKFSTEIFENKETMSNVNSCEISIVVLTVRALLKAGVSARDVGIIAPYSLQVATLSEALKDFEDIEVKTVDQFQGKDKEIIIYSCTKSSDLSNPMKINKYNILEDKRRLTVAITRAKHKFILLGDMECMRNYSPFKQLLNKLPDSNFIKLQSDQLGFSWDGVYELLKLA